jgi:outer membrane protein OmpA-like peptidoglycan-associated protein
MAPDVLPLLLPHVRAANSTVERKGKQMIRPLSRPLAALLIAANLTACAGMSNQQKGAVIGAGAGAAVGGVVGKHQGSTVKGAIIGAAVGGVAGAIIGAQMDKQAKELEQNIPGAVVERVGEGIQVTFASGILFPFDSDQLLPAARTNLNNLAQSLGKYPNTELLIAGHTDDVGTEQYNMDLSQRRAQSAARFLVQQGVMASRLRTVGLGESEPVASNVDAEGRQKNRRVEVAIFADQSLRTQALREASLRPGS